MTERPVPTMSRKRTTETVPVGYDFTNDLPSGVTVSSAGTTTATVASDSAVADASPSSIINGAASAATPIITQSITAGTDGAKYFLKFIATGSDGETYEGEATILIANATTDDEG